MKKVRTRPIGYTPQLGGEEERRRLQARQPIGDGFYREENGFVGRAHYDLQVFREMLYRTLYKSLDGYVMTNEILSAL